VYRFFCLGAHYRAKLNFSWEGMDGAKISLDRLRTAVFEWGEAGKVDEDYLTQFTNQINDDLNMPRALAVTWDLVRSALPSPVKKATIQVFDKVLGLRLQDWQPKEDVIPEAVQELVRRRQEARREKRWADADALRQEVFAAGFEIEDTPQGPKVKARRVEIESP
jgi:cysteinyl-tRNA synthetase